MKAPPNNTDIIAILYMEMSEWKKAGMTADQSQIYFEKLSERLINYFHLHYSIGPTATSSLPGLPSSRG